MPPRSDPLQPSVLLRDPAFAGCGVSMDVRTAGDAGYVNPDGNPVEAPAGTLFADLTLSPAPGSEIRVEVALPPPERWDGRIVGVGNGGGGEHHEQHAENQVVT